MYGVLNDIFRRYLLIGPYWKLFTYLATIIFMRGMVARFKRKKMSASRCLLIVLLFFYLLTIYTSTVLARSQRLRETEMLPLLWSWKSALSGRKYVQHMVIENIIMLMPIGLSLPLIFNRKRIVMRTIVCGFLFSLFIEVSQKLFRVGYYEMDDLINNTIGVIVGCAISSAIKRVLNL